MRVKNIINSVNNILDQYTKEMGYNSLETTIINSNDIYECVIYPNYEYERVTNIDLGFTEVTEEKILGKTIFKERVILIDKSIAPGSGDPRYPFTFGHEIGHVDLHADKKQPFSCSAQSITSETNIYERQANYFSENLLMPDRLVVYRFKKFYGPSKPIIYTGEGGYWLGYLGKYKEQYVCSLQDYCKKLARPLTWYFSNISKQSLGYKLYKLGLIQNMTKESFFDITCENSISKALVA